MDEWLKGQLRRREWTQADLARRMAVSTGTISRWARGERIPTPESCDRLADVLGVDLDTVLGVAGHRPPDSVYGANDARNDIISQLPKLTDDQAALALGIVNVLIAEEMKRRRRRRGKDQAQDDLGERHEGRPLGRGKDAAVPAVAGPEVEVAAAEPNP